MKYVCTTYVEVKKTWYVNAPDEETAFERVCDTDPDEEEEQDNCTDVEIEEDHSLDDYEESVLKEGRL